MKLKLQRTGEVNSFDAIATLEWFSGNRPDLVELLTYIRNNGKSASVGLLANVMEGVPDFAIAGVVDYLKNTGFIHAHGKLSAKGAKVAETGKVPIEEKGQFRFYWIDDPMLRNHVLHFERSNQLKSERVEYLDVSLYKDKLYKSVINKSEFQLKEFDGQSKAAYATPKTGSYKLEWEIDLSRHNQSKINVSGALQSRNKGNQLRYTSQEVDGEFPGDPYHIIGLIIEKAKKPEMEWDQAKGMLRVPVASVNQRELETLITSLDVTETIYLDHLGSFDPTVLHNVPIGPSSRAEAKKWIVSLVQLFLKEEYKSELELQAYLEEVKEYRAFIGYEDVIDELTVSELLEKIRRKEDFSSYWNLQAPSDLYLDIDERFIVRNKRVDLAPGTRYSMAEIVDELVDADTPDTLIFSSKYVHNPLQIRKFELFVKAFKARGVKNVLLVTKQPAKLEDKDIRTELYDSVYGGSVPPHDRYFAFRTDNQWRRFKMSAELDQCRYERPFEATEYTQGKWLDISFMEIKTEVFPEKLNEQLTLLEEVYYL